MEMKTDRLTPPELSYKTREYWKAHTQPGFLDLVEQTKDALLEDSAQYELKYNKNYIGLVHDGEPTNLLNFASRSGFMSLRIKAFRMNEIEKAIAEKGIALKYDEPNTRYKIAIQSIADVKLIKNELLQLVSAAKHRLGKY